MKKRAVRLGNEPTGGKLKEIWKSVERNVRKSLKKCEKVLNEMWEKVERNVKTI